MSNPHCIDCADKISDIQWEKKETKKVLKELKAVKLEYKRISGKISLLENKFNRTAKFQITETIKPVQSIKHYERLEDYLMKLPLPESFLSVCKDQELAMSFMMKTGIVPQSIDCPRCQMTTVLHYYGFRGYSFKCPSCKNFTNVRDLTIWSKTKLTIDKLLLFMFLWVISLKDREIACLLDISEDVAAQYSRSLRKVVGNDIIAKTGKLDGVVEIEIHNFIKRKIEIGKSRGREKWILIMYERENSKVYADLLEKKTPEHFMPIILEKVQIGSVVITDDWGPFNNLEDYGYPHYKFDRNQGFLDTGNPDLHTNHIKVLWLWIKYDIKHRNRTALFLQEHLNEWIWRRSIKHTCKKYTWLETAEIMRCLIEALARNSKFT